MMDKRTVIAILLSLAVMVLWNVWYFNRYKDVLEKQQVETAQKKTEADSVSGGEPSPTAPAGDGDAGFSPDDILPAEVPADAPPVAAPVEKPAEAEEKLITVDTGVAQVTLSGRGGVITSVKLLAFHDQEGKPVELVAAKTDNRPLAVEFATPDASRKINNAVFSTDAPESIALAEGKEETVTFTYMLEGGFSLIKKLTFRHMSYKIDAEVTLSHPGAGITGSTYGLIWPGLAEDGDSMYSYSGPVILVDDKRLAEEPDEGEKKVYEGEVEWAGLTNKYYCAALIPDEKNTKVTFRRIGDKTYSAALQMVSREGEETKRLSVYVGPKTHKDVKKAGRELSRVINYGWFDIIAKPLFKLLIWVYGVTGNFGWSIIVLTMLVKVLFLPLTHKSIKSMEKMKKVQPQMKMLQERYKNDKSKMNEELMALYRKHEINPLAGCLPMLLQLPVFIALYKVLLESIELKGAPFMFWITDLSAKDPYYVTPILMGASMMLQMRLSPSGTDPIQKNMMMIMPVIFTVMFLSFPSGLVIYWLVNNVLSIAQQWYINKTHTH